jgi:hypothetical protein
MSAAADGYTAVLPIPSDLCVGAKNNAFSSATTQFSVHRGEKMYHNTEQVSKNDTETETRKKERVVQ